MAKIILEDKEIAHWLAKGYDKEDLEQALSNIEQCIVDWVFAEAGRIIRERLK